jgi:integrase
MPTVTLTAKSLDTLKPTGQQVDYFDAGANVPGFGLRVGARRATWFLLYRDPGGRLRRHKLGTHPPMKLKAARELARTSLLQVQTDTADPAAAKKARRSALTFDQLADRFIEDYAKPRKKTWDDDARHLRVFCRPRWKGSATEVTRAQVRELLTEVARERGGTTANRLRSTISKLCRWAVAQGYLDDNPAAGLPAPGKEHARDRALTDDELVMLWQQLEDAQARDEDDDTYIAPEVVLWLKLRLLTGQRGETVRNMQWAHVDLKRRVWEIPAELMKKDRPHVVPLAPWVVTLLETRRAEVADDEVYVLAGGRARQHRRGFTHALDIENFIPRDLRRTTATGMGRLGVSRFIIARVLAHADPSVTGIYDRFEYLEEKRAALDKWAAHVQQVLRRGKKVVALPARRRA